MLKIGFIGTDEMFQTLTEIANTKDWVSIVRFDKKMLSDNVLGVSYMFVRGTKSINGELRDYVVRNHASINFLDNIDRFLSDDRKLLTSKERFIHGVGAKTWDYDSVRLDNDITYPLYAKPDGGSRGRGVMKLESYDHFLTLERCGFFDKEAYLFQSVLDIKTEYRVVMLNIGGVREYYVRRKLRADGEKQAKRTVSSANRDKLINFLSTKRAFKKGILGTDIAILKDGTCSIIEENRAPMFDITSKVFGISFEERIIDLIIKDYENGRG